MFNNWDENEEIFELNKISKLFPVILNCDENENELLKVSCVLEVGTGGNLIISTASIDIFDQENEEVSYSNLCSICDDYWSSFRKDKLI